jgi:cytochrome b
MGEKVRVRIWDLPIRLFHWLIVVLFAFSWWTAENDALDWHFLSGYAILGLVIFRIYWGFVGSTTARFSTFLKGPKAFLIYAVTLFSRGKDSVGHNPMGGWSVLVMLLLLLTQTVLGLFAIDVDGVNSGPLDHLVSFDTGRQFAHIHGIVFNLLLGLTGLHLVVILFYVAYKRDNLIGAMVSGRKTLVEGEQASGLRFSPLWWALPGVAVAALIVALVVRGHL